MFEVVIEEGKVSEVKVGKREPREWKGTDVELWTVKNGREQRLGTIYDAILLVRKVDYITYTTPAGEKETSVRVWIF